MDPPFTNAFNKKNDGRTEHTIRRRYYIVICSTRGQ